MQSLILVLLILIQVLTAGWFKPQEISVGSFNTMNYGEKRSRSEKLRFTLANIICSFDVISLQEIKSIDPSFIDLFSKSLQERNSYNYQCHGKQYQLAVQEPTGSSNSKESIYFFYNSQKLRLLEAKSYKKLPFERAPFIGHFQSIEKPDFSFVYIASHLKPANVIEELNFLKKVYQNAVKSYPEASSIFIMGDLNADCSYLPKKDYEQIDFIRQKNYQILIDFEQDTTTFNSKCAYDRIIIENRFLPSVVPMTAHVFHYQKKFRYISELELQAISNHYPIGFRLYAKNLNPSRRTWFEWMFGKKLQLSSDKEIIVPKNKRTKTEPVKEKSKEVIKKSLKPKKQIQKSAETKEIIKKPKSSLKSDKQVQKSKVEGQRNRKIVDYSQFGDDEKDDMNDPDFSSTSHDD